MRIKRSIVARCHDAPAEAISTSWQGFLQQRAGERSRFLRPFLLIITGFAIRTKKWPGEIPAIRWRDV
jgi:hypothetical protein